MNEILPMVYATVSPFIDWQIIYEILYAQNAIANSQQTSKLCFHYYCAVYDECE